MLKIVDAVDGVFEQLKEHGLAEYTLQQNMWSVYRAIIKYHFANGTDEYSSQLVTKLPMYTEYCQKYHGSNIDTDLLFYTKRKGLYSKMSSDNVRTFVEQYGAEQGKNCRLSLA